MRLPKQIEEIIQKEMERNSKNCMMQLVRRKGDQEEQLEDIYTGQQVTRTAATKGESKGAIYDLLSEKQLATTNLLEYWAKFHGSIIYPDFPTFYSKRKFCSYFFQTDKDMTQPLSIDEDCFIALLADRKFLFLEDNEHGNNPEYPPLSEIVRNPERYLTQTKSPPISDTSHDSNSRMCENAEVVLSQGFVPTRAHKRAYDELRGNEEDIRTALAKREKFLHHDPRFIENGEPHFPTFTIPISQPQSTPTAIDRELSQLFHDFLYAVSRKAYVMDRYDDLCRDAKENSLGTISCIREYLEQNENISVCKPLVFWWLFTKETTKVAKGNLKEFKFCAPLVKDGRRLTRKTQAPSYRKINCQIMLFDYLLKICTLEDERERQIREAEAEKERKARGEKETDEEKRQRHKEQDEEQQRKTGYAKFQFHVFTRYNGYTHFRVGDMLNLAISSVNGCKFNFDLIPDSKDCVDHFGGVIRYHILRCISNDVRWLTPGLPNNWNINSSILATLLLQDAAQFPKVRRLTNRIGSFLKDKESNKYMEAYLSLEDNQPELIEQLNKWCIDNDLVFEEDIPSSDLEISDDKMKLLCSRLVLEYALKERTLVDVRRGLSVAADSLWGDYLLKGFETFYLEEDV